MNIKKYIYSPRNWLLLTVAILLSTEFSVRYFGMVDFPLYDSDSKIGYIPSANQNGSFLNKNDWEFNSLHMGASDFKPNPLLDTLLVGDSVVLGGNPIKQMDRLGPSLQKLMQQSAVGAQVWPISAGSWALRNELTWLRQNPQVIDQVHRIVFVLNSGDFGEEASSWRCELTHPRSRPLIATWYLLNKYVYPFEKCGDIPASLKVPNGNLANELKEYITTYGKKTTFILYPDKPESTDKILEERTFKDGNLILKMAGASTVFQVSSDHRWNNKWYRDGIHPNPEGNNILAKIIIDNQKN